MECGMQTSAGAPTTRRGAGSPGPGDDTGSTGGRAWGDSPMMPIKPAPRTILVSDFVVGCGILDLRGAGGKGGMRGACASAQAVRGWAVGRGRKCVGSGSRAEHGGLLACLQLSTVLDECS